MTPGAAASTLRVDDKTLLAALRADVYSFLAGMLVEPASAKALTLLGGDAAAELLAPFDDGLVDRLRAAVLEASADELRQEFWDLFVVPGVRFTTPFQSVFLDVREIAGESVSGLQMGASALAVRSAYEAEGFEPDDSRPLPPDHVAIELAFLARLCDKERNAWQSGDAAAATLAREAAWCFLRGHLARWLTRLKKKVEQNARLGLYPALLQLACRVIDEDERYLQDITS